MIDNNIANIAEKLKNNEISLQSLDQTEKEKIYNFLKNEVINKRYKLVKLKSDILCRKATYKK